MKNTLNVLIILLLLALFAAVVLSDASRHDYERQLDGKIKTLHIELQAQIRQLRADICRAMDTGRCQEGGK